MPDPNWQLWEVVLQQLQSGITDLKRDMTAMRADVAEIKADLRMFKGQLRYAVGTAGVAEYQSTQAEESTRVLKERLDEVIARLEVLEHPDA